jgi:hypothetical protein
MYSSLILLQLLIHKPNLYSISFYTRTQQAVSATVLQTPADKILAYHILSLGIIFFFSRSSFSKTNVLKMSYLSQKNLDLEKKQLKHRWDLAKNGKNLILIILKTQPNC